MIMTLCYYVRTQSPSVYAAGGDCTAIAVELDLARILDPRWPRKWIYYGTPMRGYLRSRGGGEQRIFDPLPNPLVAVHRMLVEKVSKGLIGSDILVSGKR